MQEFLGSVVEVGDEAVEQLGCLCSRSTAQARVVAVVSWPAASMVINSSAISARVIGEPSS